MVVASSGYTAPPAVCRLLGICDGIDRSDLPVSSLALEAEYAVNFGEKGIITANTDILTRMDLGAALSVQNIAGLNVLSVCSLGAKPLGLGISAVLGRTDSLLMREELKIHL